MDRPLPNCLRCERSPRQVGLYCQRCYARSRKVVAVATVDHRLIHWQQRHIYGGDAISETLRKLVDTDTTRLYNSLRGEQSSLEKG